MEDADAWEPGMGGMTEEEAQAWLRERLLGISGGHRRMTMADLLSMGQPNRLQIQGGGGIGGGLISGGGMASLEMPMDRMSSLLFNLGGGGAYGSVGGNRVKEFSPELGVQYRRAF
ncbi:MAG: hypothetical protein HC794_08780 [Nitrospiraceae bacterium]|nr:hypothetical protein [Nitrospiraceae bacterium]